MMSNCRDLWTDAGETVHTTLGIVRVPDASPLHPSPVGILSAVQHLGRHRDHTGRGTAATDRGRREDPARLTPRQVGRGGGRCGGPSAGEVPAVGRLATWAIPLGLEPVADVLLHPSTIERFAAHAPGHSPVSRRTLRTNLRFLARAVVPHLVPADTPLPWERATAPYTPGEIDGLFALADAQPTLARRMHLGALVCLGAGAGLIRADLRQARGTDVTARSGGLVVTVQGARARVVPVLARYQPRLVQAAAFAGGRFGVGGFTPDRPNLTNPLVSRLVGGDGLPVLDTSRLRATWLGRDRGSPRPARVPAGCRDLLLPAARRHHRRPRPRQRAGRRRPARRPDRRRRTVDGGRAAMTSVA